MRKSFPIDAVVRMKDETAEILYTSLRDLTDTVNIIKSYPKIALITELAIQPPGGIFCLRAVPLQIIQFLLRTVYSFFRKAHFLLGS